MHEMPAVSVVINCLNGERYLQDALDSVYAQTFTDWEIILLDNASTDSTPKIARTYSDGRLRYFRTPSTLPLGEARNQALVRCRGRFIAFLDSDDLWLPDKLAMQVHLFEDPEVGLAFTNCVSFTDSGKTAILYRDRTDYSTGACFDRLLRRYFLVLSSVVVRRVNLERVGGLFNPSLQVSEETDLFLRIAYTSKLAAVDKCLTRYRVHPGSDTWRKSALFAEEAETIISMFQSTFPDFSARYAAEAREWLDRVHFGNAISRWRAGSSSHARALIRELHTKSMKTSLTYCATYLPFALLRPMIKIASGRIYPDA